MRQFDSFSFRSDPPIRPITDSSRLGAVVSLDGVSVDARGDGSREHRDSAQSVSQDAPASDAPSGHDAPVSHDAPEYRPDLGTVELIVEVRRLLATGRRIERLLCRYLADMADRLRQGNDTALWHYADEFHAARCFFGLGVRDTRERVRVGRSLRRLPRIEAAFVCGQLSYSRAREITRVAEPQSEANWLELARTLGMRALERRVAEARARSSQTSGSASIGGSIGVGGDGCLGVGSGSGSIGGSIGVGGDGCLRVGGSGDVGGGMDGVSRRSVGGGDGERKDGGERPGLGTVALTEWLSRNALRVTFELSAEAWALIEHALEGARRSGAPTMSDAEALVAVARDALSAQARDSDAGDPRLSVVVHECETFRQGGLDSGVGLRDLSPSAAPAIGCRASELDQANQDRAVRRGGPLSAAIHRGEMLYDDCRCRVPGCAGRRSVEVHPLMPQASGGEYSLSDCFVLCAVHHGLLHHRKIAASGDAEGGLCFRDGQGRPLVDPIGGAGVVGEGDGSDGAGSVVGADGSEASTDFFTLADQRARRHAAGGHIESNSACGTTQRGISEGPAARLLQVIGRRGGWSMDALIEKSGLSAREVAVALTLLELGGRVRYRDFVFDPV